MLSEERKAIVAYLREVAEAWSGPGFDEADTNLREAVKHVLDVCANDIENDHEDTVPHAK